MFPPRPEAEEPYLGAWLEVGDLVEGNYKGTCVIISRSTRSTQKYPKII